MRTRTSDLLSAPKAGPPSVRTSCPIVLLHLWARLDGQLDAILGLPVVLEQQFAFVPFPASHLMMHGRLRRSLVLRTANNKRRIGLLRHVVQVSELVDAFTRISALFNAFTRISALFNDLWGALLMLLAVLVRALLISFG